MKWNNNVTMTCVKCICTKIHTLCREKMHLNENKKENLVGKVKTVWYMLWQNTCLIVTKGRTIHKHITVKLTIDRAHIVILGRLKYWTAVLCVTFFDFYLFQMKKINWIFCVYWRNKHQIFDRIFVGVESISPR